MPSDDQGPRTAPSASERRPAPSASQRSSTKAGSGRNNVVNIQPDVPVRGLRAVQADVVAELERLLEEARAGELTGLAYAGHYYDATTTNRYVGVVSRALVGAMFAVMSRATQRLDEDGQPTPKPKPPPDEPA